VLEEGLADSGSTAVRRSQSCRTFDSLVCDAVYKARFMPMDAGPILQSVLEAGLGDSGSTAVRRSLAELLRDAWGGREELRDSLLRAPLLALLGDPDGEPNLQNRRWFHVIFICW